jgi:hypothetical protein
LKPSEAGSALLEMKNKSKGGLNGYLVETMGKDATI